MKKLTIYFALMLVMSAIALAQTMTREMPLSINPGQEFKVRYQTHGTSGNFGVLIEEDVSGGCSPSHIATGFLSPAQYTDLTFKSPSSGTCKFTGNYQFAGTSGIGILTSFPEQTTAVTAVTAGCTSSTWNPSRSTECSGVKFTQTSNCGTERRTIGTKVCNGGENNSGKDSGSGVIFIILVVGIVLYFIFIKSATK